MHPHRPDKDGGFLQGLEPSFLQTIDRAGRELKGDSPGTTRRRENDEVGLELYNNKDEKGDYRSLCSLYSTLSRSASQEAWMIFSDTPTVPHRLSLSRDSMITRTRAAVPSRALTTRTL